MLGIPNIFLSPFSYLLFLFKMYCSFDLRISICQHRKAVYTPSPHQEFSVAEFAHCNSTVYRSNFTVNFFFLGGGGLSHILTWTWLVSYGTTPDFKEILTPCLFPECMFPEWYNPDHFNIPNAIILSPLRRTIQDTPFRSDWTCEKRKVWSTRNQCSGKRLVGMSVARD